MSQRNPEKILDIFDEFDLDMPEERRMALFTLNDYFGAIFTEVGEKLDFRTSDYGMSIGHQWDKASSRIEEIDSIDIPREYYGSLETIHELRGDYAHDFNDHPPVDPIESARRIAPEWAEWIREAAVEYERYQESLTATEALVQVGERALDGSLDDLRGLPQQFTGRAKNLKGQSEDLEEDIQDFRNDDEVTKELVEVISDILEWERDKKQLEEDVDKWHKEEAKRREQLHRGENTYNFVVVDDAGDFDRIAVVKHEIGEPDDSFSFTISDNPISQSEKEYLRNLNVNEEVRLWIGRKMYRNRNGRFDQMSVIEEVVGVDTSSEE